MRFLALSSNNNVISIDLEKLTRKSTGGQYRMKETEKMGKYSLLFLKATERRESEENPLTIFIALKKLIL